MYQVFGRIYKTFRLNTYGIEGFYQQSINDIPRYLSTLDKGSQSFVGIREFQLHGSTIAFGRIDYRYKHKKDIFFHLILNYLITAKSEESNNIQENLWGVGAGITLLSPVGPLEFIWSWGPQNIYSSDNQLQSIFHFSAGYNF